MLREMVKGNQSLDIFVTVYAHGEIIKSKLLIITDNLWNPKEHIL